jgi:hypothetical protein
MPKKKWVTPTVSVLGISDLDAALSLAGSTHDDVMAFAVTPVDSGEDRIVLVVYPGPKHVYTRSEIEAEKLHIAQTRVIVERP